MRIPLAPDGVREMAIITVLLGGGTAAATAAAAGGFTWCWPIAGLLLIAWAGGIAFFRDPERETPADPTLMVAPADGKIVEISRIDRHDDLPGLATRVSIFLSIFDVHVNRSPCAGVVRSIRYTPGKFLDARDPESGRANESNTIVIEPDPPHAGPVVVRQIAGLVARRIVCGVKVGQRLEAGQRIGLIKFGSRTELIVPGHDLYAVAVGIDDRARGARTVLLQRADVPIETPAEPRVTAGSSV